jgi:uncharacterized membrane protein
MSPAQKLLRRVIHGAWEATRRYFATGLLAFAPLAITIWAILWIVTRLDNLLLPKVLDIVVPGLETPPQAPPLVGAIFTFGVILASGVFVRHFFGAQLVRLSERLLARVPVARSIYAAVKQLVEAIFRTNSASTFNRVVIIEYPRKGVFALAFTTGDTEGPAVDALPGHDLVNCFVPTTPNPTSGFYLMLDRSEVRDIQISVEEAFKVIMSAGLVTPSSLEESEASSRNEDSTLPESSAHEEKVASSAQA